MNFLGKEISDVVFSCGGLVLTSADGRIVLSNTLDDRLRIAFQDNLPAIRKKLFA